MGARRKMARSIPGIAHLQNYRLHRPPTGSAVKTLFRFVVCFRLPPTRFFIARSWSDFAARKHALPGGFTLSRWTTGGGNSGKEKPQSKADAQRQSDGNGDKIAGRTKHAFPILCRACSGRGLLTCRFCKHQYFGLERSV